jgi:hypothetical protein
MKLSFRKKAILLVLSFALANVALYSIINFHQNRIFGKELITVEKYFIKKDEQYSLQKASLQQQKTQFHFGGYGITSIENIHTDVRFTTPFTLLLPFVDDKILSGISSSIIPIRGSPIA